MEEGQCLRTWMQDQYLFRAKLLSFCHFMHMGFHRDGRYLEPSIIMALDKYHGKRKQQASAGLHTSFTVRIRVCVVGQQFSRACWHIVLGFRTERPLLSCPKAALYHWSKGSPLGSAPECPRKACEAGLGHSTHLCHILLPVCARVATGAAARPHRHRLIPPPPRDQWSSLFPLVLHEVYS